MHSVRLRQVFPRVRGHAFAFDSFLLPNYFLLQYSPCRADKRHQLTPLTPSQFKASDMWLLHTEQGKKKTLVRNQMMCLRWRQNPQAFHPYLDSKNVMGNMKLYVINMLYQSLTCMCINRTLLYNNDQDFTV